MQIHAAAPKHREMPMGSTGFIGLRFNLMQLGISLRCMELKLNEWDICFFTYSFARLARNFLLHPPAVQGGCSECAAFVKGNHRVP